MPRDPFELVNKGVGISSPPNVYVKVRDTVDDPRASYSDIAEIISQDAALSARLLKIANSSFYNFPSRVETITHAVSIIGTRQLCELVLATTIREVFQDLPRDLVCMESFWGHSLACGLVARAIAIYRRDANVERFYVAGLLHDVGRLVIFENLPDLARQAIRRYENSRAFLHDAEREIIGFDHADAGGALLKVWGLPSSVVEIVSCHHRPADAVHYPVETAIVHAADILACAMRLGTSRENFVPPLDAAAWERLRLPASQLPLIWDRVDETFNETVQFFLD